jgi:hypothetical protein
MQYLTELYTIAVFANFAVDSAKDAVFTESVMRLLLDAKSDQVRWSAELTSMYATVAWGAHATIMALFGALLVSADKAGTARAWWRSSCTERSPKSPLSPRRTTTCSFDSLSKKSMHIGRAQSRSGLPVRAAWHNG